MEERRTDRRPQHRRVTWCSPAGPAGSRRSTRRPATPLWHSRIGTITNGPITYELDGEQHVVAASGNNVFDFVLNK